MEFKPKKSLGQNFLTNPKVSEWIAEAAKLKAGDIVLEIGPGTGMLTRELLKRGAHVIGIEADARAVAVLKKSFKNEICDSFDTGNFILHHGDIRTFDLASLRLKPRSYKLIANIPYYLSGMLFRTFLESKTQPSTLVFLVQKEVASRIARDKKESLLSLGVKAYGTPTYVRSVSRGNFNPVPAVDSAIIAVSDISKHNFKTMDESFFFEILHLGFGSKRKQLLGNLTKKFDRDVLIDIFSTLALQETIRAEDVQLGTWCNLVPKLFLHR